MRWWVNVNAGPDLALRRGVLDVRRHRLDRLKQLHYAHKLVLSIIIVFGIIAIILVLSQDERTLKIESAYGAQDPRFAAYITALLGVETTSGNEYTLLSNGDEFFPAMLDAIRNAKRRISFETYIYEKGSVADQFTAALSDAARRGVQVDLVVDAFGSNRMSEEHVEQLRQAGARIGRFGKANWYALDNLTYRTHRKILVVDGRIGFTGGAGVGDHWLGHAQDPDHWRDSMVRVTGPLARLMEGAFNENFVETAGPVTPAVDPLQSPPPPEPHDAAFVLRSSSNTRSNDLKHFYLVAIGAARHSLDICSPYFIVDESSEWALRQAAARGVKIRVLVEGDHTDALPVKYASREYYQKLMDLGIQIYEYQPTMMHTKAMVVDGTFGMFGSANFDNRSLEMNDEMNVGVSEPGFAQTLARDFERDLRLSRRLDAQTWQRRSPLEKAREYFWSFFGEVF
jgi:cardiolipin synthase